MRIWSLLVAVMISSVCHAQRVEAKPVYGAVSGSISCVDTNLPARLTQVTLQPIRESVVIPAAGTKDASTPVLSLSVHQSRLDGTFFIPRVKPGRYYVLVQKPGYLSPVALFTKEDIDNPTPELRERIAKTVPMVTVDANRTATIEIRLMRAASIGGTVRFDDGSAASHLYVSFARKDKEGKWLTDVRGTGGLTDDLGRFRVSGLPAGEYRMKTVLSVDEILTSQVFGDSGSTYSDTRYSLPVYFGDTFREKDSKTIKIDDGQEVTADLTIPNSKLHSVSGSLIEARSGRVINAGTIVLFDTDGDKQLASTKVDPDEPTFRFDFVPEGSYTVRVKDAREVTREEDPYPPGTIGNPRFKEVVVRSYGPYEGPLVVQSDAVGVTFAIPGRDARGVGAP